MLGSRATVVMSRYSMASASCTRTDRQSLTTFALSDLIRSQLFLRLVFCDTDFPSSQPAYRRLDESCGTCWHHDLSVDVPTLIAIDQSITLEIVKFLLF